jgi:F-type H+-transporting ATPase subunit b
MLAAAGNFGLSYLLEWIALAFVVAFIWRYVAPPLRKAMDAKRQQIGASLSEGDRAQTEAEALVTERRAALESAKAEAAAILAQAQQSAAAMLAEGGRRAEEERDRIISRAAAEIDGARIRLRAEVISEVGALVVAAAEQVVAAELDAANQHRLIGEAIEATEQEVGS